MISINLYNKDGKDSNLTSDTAHKSSNNMDKPDVVSTMFVPTSKRSLLFKLVCESERTVTKGMEWSIKILEQSGSPLINRFIYKYPIRDGCPKKEFCTLCSNDCIKCSVKGAIYRAYCVNCQSEITGDKGYIEGHNIPTYVGETSCPVRERISEHWRNLKN